jgi:thioredoxin reductase (NADPH)
MRLVDGRTMNFDLLYPTMGCIVHSDLATALGANSNEVGCLLVDGKQQTTVPGIYAAGDVVSDLHQLVVAEAHAAIAATAIHNSLPLQLAEPEPR